MAKNNKNLTPEEMEEVYKDISQELGGLIDNFTNPLQAITGILDNMGGKAMVLSGAFEFVASAIDKSVKASKAFYVQLNKITGINGNVGKLAEAITAAASGSVTRQQISEFLSATGTLFKDAGVMQSQLGYVKDLIGLYGDVNTAVQKFQNSLFLSAEDQKNFSEYAKKANEIIQQSPAAQLEATSNALNEIVVTIGGDLLYVLKPVLTMISSIAGALRELNGESKGQGLTEAEVYTRLQGLAEEYGMTLEELNDIEKGLFTSSLDEVTSVGSGVFDGSSLSIMSDESTEDATANIDSIGDHFKTLEDIILDVWNTFSILFDTVGPGLLSFVEGVTDVVSSIMSWADEVGVLEPVMSMLFGVLGAIVALKFSGWVAGVIQSLVALIAPTAAATTAQTGLATAGMAAAGSTTFGAAIPIIIAAIGAGVAGLAAFGLNSAGSGAAVSIPQNEYAGTDKSIEENMSVEVVLDGDKVNSALSRSNRNSGGDVE